MGACGLPPAMKRALLDPDGECHVAVCMCSVCLVRCVSLVWAKEATKEQLYLRALAQHQQKKYREARVTWRKLLDVLKREQLAQAKGSRAWHLMTIGQIDAMHYIADASWQLAEKQAACLQLHEQIVKELKMPKGWESWPIQPSLRERFESFHTRFIKDCPNVPSLVHFVVTPAHTQLMLKDSTGRWRSLQGRVLETKQKQIHIKAHAVGYIEQEFLREVERWQKNEIVLQMRMLPVSRRDPSTRPTTLSHTPQDRKRIASILHKPPLLPRSTPVPFYQTWWFWTITGVAVTGGVAVVLVATREPRYSLKGETPNQGYRVW